MMKLHVVGDVAVINRLMTDESVNADVSDDNTVGITFDALPSHCEFLGIYLDGSIQGFFVLVPQNTVTAEIHTCLLPSIRGVTALQAGKLLLNYLFSKYQKAISWIPDGNRKALLYSLKLGFVVEGLSQQSFLKNGQLIDQKLVGMTRERYLCQ